MFFCAILVNAQNWQAVPMVSQKILDTGNSGGEGCQWPQAIEADKKDGSFLLFGTDVGGIYRSINGGINWEPCNIGYHPRGNCGFAIDPNNNQRALAVGGNSINNSTHGIYLTTNQAASWNHVFQETNYTGYRDFKDKIAFDGSSYEEEPGYSKIAYWSNPAGGLFKSVTGGESWEKVNSNFGNCIIKVSPGNGTLYLGNNTGFYRSDDGGKTVTLVFEGVIRDLDVVYSSPSKVLVTTARELFVSDDHGETFSKIESVHYPNNVVTLKVSNANADYLVVCNSEGEYSKPIYWSTDGGISWQKAQMNHSNAFMPFNGRTQKFAWHPEDENKVWAFGGDWITSSRNGGKNFEWDANGYTGILVGGFFNFNLSNPDLLYLASQDYNGAFTKNNGKTWKYCNASGLGWGGFTYGAYAASENVLVTQVSSGWNQPGNLAISRDGGNSFEKTSLICNGLKVSCGDAKDPNVIYFSEFYTKNLGETWETMKDCKGVFIANLFGEKEVYGANGNNVVKSSDKGDTWQRVIALPQNVADVAIDHIKNRLYIVTSGDRLFHYENEKLTELTSRIPVDQFNNRAIRTVAVDPNNPKIIYTAGPKNIYKTDASVKRSIDGGETWEIITPNNRTHTGHDIRDGANEVFALRVNPKTRELWVAGGCYGVWKEIPDNKMTIMLSGPEKDSVFCSGDLVFKVEVYNEISPVSKVEFFNEEKKIGELNEEPFQFIFECPDSGNINIYAKVTDTDGNTAYSGNFPLKMLITEMPLVSVISPANHTVFNFDSTIEIIARASSPDGTITKLEIFNGTEKLAENSDSTLAFSLENVPAGIYTITAKVTDNSGQTVTSPPVVITVKTEDGYYSYFEDFNDGEAQGWIPVRGEWTVENNQYRNATSDGIETSIYHGSTFADYTFSAKMKSDWNNNFGLIFNYVDEYNYYLIELDAQPTAAFLKRRKNGTETIISQSNYTGGGAGIYVTIEVMNDGNFTSVKINNTLIFNQIPTSDFSFGKIGLYSWWNPVWIDDVFVIAKGRDFSTSSPAFAENKVHFTVFPNPVINKEFTVSTQFISGQPAYFFLYCLEGKLVLSSAMPENLMQFSIPASGLRGVYIAKLISGKNTFQQKIIIQ
jgi:photosystem II stability/assembly factor-like uncharacterized protein